MGELVAKLLQKMPVAIMSGADFTQFEKQFLPVLTEKAHRTLLYLFPDNAAQCFMYVNDSWRLQYDNSFTEEERAHILNALNLALKKTGLAEIPLHVWGNRIEDRGAQITFSGLGQKAPLREKKIWDPHREKRVHLRNTLMKYLPEFSEAVGGSTSVDITRKGITKAYGIIELSKLTNIPISDMVYVGDALEEGGNDAVVKETGIKTISVETPADTARLIQSIVSKGPRHAPVA